MWSRLMLSANYCNQIISFNFTKKWRFWHSPDWDIDSRPEKTDYQSICLSVFLSICQPDILSVCRTRKQNNLYTIEKKFRHYWDGGWFSLWLRQTRPEKADRFTDGQKWTDKQTDKETDRQLDGRIDKMTDQQTDIQSDSQTIGHYCTDGKLER